MILVAMKGKRMVKEWMAKITTINSLNNGLS